MKNKSAKNAKKNSLKMSKLGIVFGSLLSAGTIASSAVCLWQVNKEKTSSSDFASSTNARIEIDPVAFEPEGSKTFENAKKNVKQAAETLSDWLKNQGQENYDVAYECYQKEENVFSAFLNTRFTVDKIKNKKPTSKEEEEEKIDNDPYLSIFSSNGVNTNNRSIVYRWYIPATEEKTTSPTFSVINLKELLSIPKDLSKQDNPTKIIANKDGKWGIMYHIEDNKLLNAIYNDMAKAYNYTQEEDPKPSGNAKTLDNWRQPRLYVINNLEGLINEANYHVINYLTKDTSYNTDYRKIYSGTEYETFASNFITGKDDKGDESHKTNTSFGRAKVSTEIDPAIVAEKGFSDVDNYEVLRYIDAKTPGTVDTSFMKKYVEKVWTITSKNFQQAFPGKITDEYTNEVDETLKDLDKTKLQYLWYEGTDKEHSTEHLSQMSKYQLPCKIVNVKLGSPQSTDTKTKFEKFKESYITVKVQPKFIDTIFGGNKVQLYLSLGFLIFLIALLVILACLYRMTGVFSWICMMFMLSLSQLIATLNVGVVSMATLIGLFAVAIIGFVTCLGICGRIKRRLNSNEDTQVMIVKGFKKSLFPTLDFSIISLIFGICLTYIAPMSLNVFGILLVVAAFANFLITYLLNGAIQLLIFKNQLTLNKFKLFGKPSNKANEELRQGNMQVPSSIDASKLGFDYYSSMGVKKTNLFTKKTWIILIVLGAVFITGFVLLGVMGFVTQSMFHSSQCIAIYCSDDLLKQQWFIDAGLKYTYYRNYDNWWYFYTSENVTQAVQSLIASGHVTLGESICVQTIVGSTNIDILSKALLAIIVSASIISVYSIVRFNVASFAPALFGSFIIPLLMLAVFAIVQIKFDQTVVLGFVLATLINALILMNTLATIQDAWSRRDAYNREELRYIINTAFKSNWTFIWSLGLGLLILVICFAITGPNVPLNISMVSITGVMLFGPAIALFVTPFSVAYLEYFFLGFRNNILAKRAKRLSAKVVVNYDEIDEQTIEGVNKFTKVKQVPIYEPWRKKKENEQDTTKNI